VGAHAGMLWGGLSRAVAQHRAADDRGERGGREAPHAAVPDARAGARVHLDAGVSPGTRTSRPRGRCLSSRSAARRVRSSRPAMIRSPRPSTSPSFERPSLPSGSEAFALGFSRRGNRSPSTGAADTRRGAGARVPGRSGADPSSASRRTRSGRASAYQRAQVPPIELPAIADDASPSSSTTSSRNSIAASRKRARAGRARAHSARTPADRRRSPARPRDARAGEAARARTCCCRAGTGPAAPRPPR
jgi:hypothetical protein